MPVSLQPLFVFLAGLVLGPRRGALCVGLYVLAGALDLPVFAGGRAGLGHILGPTDGYLFGFILSAAACGLATGGKDGPLPWDCLQIVMAAACYRLLSRCRLLPGSRG